MRNSLPAGRFAAVAALLLLSGCLVSKQPLIVDDNAAYPFEDGLMLEEYALEKEVPVPKPDARTGAPPRGTLARDGGYYVWNGGAGKLRFRLSRIGRGLYLTMTPPMDRGPKRGNFPVDYSYGLLKWQFGGYYASYAFAAKDFVDYDRYMRLVAPAEWRRTSAQQWRAANSGADIEIASLQFLAAVLPDMAAKGLHLPKVTVYGPPSRLEKSAASGPDGAAPRRVLDLDDESRRLVEQSATLLDETKALEEELKKMCAGHVCRKLADKREAYRTETLRPPLWYFADGRLVPRELWPQ